MGRRPYRSRAVDDDIGLGADASDGTLILAPILLPETGHGCLSLSPGRIVPPPRVVLHPGFIVAVPRGSPHGRGEKNNALLRTGQYQTNTHRLYSSGTVFVLPLVGGVKSVVRVNEAGRHSWGPQFVRTSPSVRHIPQAETEVEATMATDVVNSDARLMLLFA